MAEASLILGSIERPQELRQMSLGGGLVLQHRREGVVP